MTTYQTIVLGLDALGSETTHQLAKLGAARWAAPACAAVNASGRASSFELAGLGSWFRHYENMHCA
jgi:hypothetical protein